MIRMIHILVSEFDIVLGGDVIGDIVIDNQPKESVQYKHIDFLEHFVEFGLNEDITFAF